MAEIALRPIFPTFLWSDLRKNNLGNRLERSYNLYQQGFHYFVVFLVNWEHRFCLNSIFQNSEGQNCCTFQLFLLWGVSVHFSWAEMTCFTFNHWPASAIYIRLLHRPEIQRLSRLNVRTSWIRNGCYVINCLLFVEKIFDAERLVCSFGNRTAFPLIVTNWSQPHLTEVRTSETASEFSCELVAYSEECSPEVD